MNFPFLKNPNTGKQDVMVTLSTLVTLAATLKFLLDGVTLTISGHNVDFGHIDAMTYAAFLTPVIGAHGYMASKSPSSSIEKVFKDEHQD